jgi:hypothetical protein
MLKLKLGLGLKLKLRLGTKAGVDEEAELWVQTGVEAGMELGTKWKPIPFLYSQKRFSQASLLISTKYIP